MLANVLAASALLFAPPQQPTEAADVPAAAVDALHQALAEAVDRPTAAERARAAAALAQRSDVTLDQWLAACAALAPAAPLQAGLHTVTAPLQVRDAVEDTELHLYVPAAAIGHAAPLLLWGHGAGGNGAGQHRSWQAVADRLGLVVLAPTEFSREDGWGFTARERLGQLAALRWARRHVDVAEDAVFVGGVSRGGHMAWELLLRWPDLFAGGLPCIGGPRLQIGPQNNIRFLENVVDVPIRDLQGSRDDPLLLANLRLAFARLQKFGGKDQQLVEFADLGHSYDPSAVDWIDFFARRRPVRTQVVRMATAVGEARSGFAEILAVDGTVQETFELRVGQKQWAGLDEAGQRGLVLDQAIAKTARLEATMAAPGRFTVKARGVTKCRLLLTAAMLAEDGSVTVQWQGRTIKRKPAAVPAVLLGEFVERFDRTFLPVAEVVLP